MFPLLLLALAFVPLAVEARRAAAHDRALRDAGALEPGHDVFPLMRVAYPAAFLAMAIEAWIRGRHANAMFAIGLIVFVLAKWIKYWAIAALGPRWSFRVLVLPGAALITSGPYRFMRHPNYLGVIGEIVGMAIMAQAPWAGVTSLLVFAALVAMRIRVEERALGRPDSP